MTELQNVQRAKDQIEEIRERFKISLEGTGSVVSEQITNHGITKKITKLEAFYDAARVINLLDYTVIWERNDDTLNKVSLTVSIPYQDSAPLVQNIYTLFHSHPLNRKLLEEVEEALGTRLRDAS